jgi:hypothetical protein
MGFGLRKRNERSPAQPAAARRIAVLAMATVGLLIGSVAFAFGAWGGSGSGGGSSKAHSLPTGNSPTTSINGRNVAVSWTTSSYAGSTNVSDYTVKRYDSGGTVQSIGSNCSGTISALTCTESNVPSGSWKYSVTPKAGNNWVGTESSQSTTQVVPNASYTLSSSSTVTSLPATLNGSLAAFKTGATVTYRLDDPSTGTLLGSTTTPSTIATNGTATNAVTIPSGTANGSHTIYAIGSSGDQASVAITLNVPLSVLGSAWDVTDASTGTAVDTSGPPAFAADGRTGASGNFATTFSTSRYIQFDYYPALPTGLTVAGVNFNFRFASGRNNDNACYYFDVRRASTGAVLGTHGSAASPIACNSTLTYSSLSTPLPEITSSADADDLRVRMYFQTQGRGVTTDLATVTGTYSDGIFSNTPFTLNDSIDTDASSGTATNFPWGLAAAGDSGATAAYQTGAWSSAFSSTRYLDFVFPSNVPAGSVISQVSLDHAFKSLASGQNSCYYIQVFSGATLLATKGSAASPIACNSTGSYVTNNISLPEVDTAAEANGLRVRMFVRNSANAATLHDHLRLNLKYAQ